MNKDSGPKGPVELIMKHGTEIALIIFNTAIWLHNIKLMLTLV